MGQLALEIERAATAFRRAQPWKLSNSNILTEFSFIGRFSQRNTLAIGSICTLLLDYLEAALQTREGGPAAVYLSFRKVTHQDFGRFLFLYTLPSNAAVKPLSDILVSSILSPEMRDMMAAEYDRLYSEKTNIFRDAKTPLTEIVRYLAAMAEKLTRELWGILDNITDETVLAVYDICGQQYLENDFEDDKANYADWINRYPKRDRRKQNEAYKDGLLKTLSMTKLLKKAMERMDPVWGGDGVDEARAAMQYLSDTNGLPDRDAVGRLLLEMRCTLSDEAIRDYFRYIHMCAYIDGRELPAPTYQVEHMTVNNLNGDVIETGATKIINENH